MMFSLKIVFLKKKKERSVERRARGVMKKKMAGTFQIDSSNLGHVFSQSETTFLFFPF